jgi:transcriptional regulator with XRE-family HTH domain
MVGDTRLPNEALRQTRLSRGWSLEETAEQIRHLAFRLGEPEPGVDGNMISRWERGLHRPGPRYVRLLSLLLDEAPADLGLPSPTSGPLPGRASETYELARHASVSEVDAAALDDLDRAVDRLSREYSTSPPAALLTAVQQRLWHIDHLLGKRLTLDQHRRLLDSAGWLHVLIAVLHYDLGEREAAEVGRDAALHLGQEAGNPEVQAWAFEAPAYFAIFEGRPRDAVDLCLAGQQVAPLDSSVFAALNMQEARAWARLGDRRAAEEALLRGGDVLDRLPEPEHPDHHFVFDVDKFAYYASTTYAWLGMPKETGKYADEVIRNNQDPSRPNFWPGRVRGAHLDLGLALAKQGHADEAAAEGLLALADYVPRTWILRRARDLDQALRARGEVREVKDFHQHYITARRGGEPKTDW